MDPLTALTIGSIAAGGIGNLAGGLSRARQLYSPEMEDEVRRQQALRDESARQFMQDARASQAGQMLDVQSAAQQQAALMGAQGGFTGREQMNAALALQQQRAAQEQALRAQQAQMQMQLDMQRAQENAALAQREADARAARTQAIAGALGTAATQSLGVAQQQAAMRQQQSFQQQLLNTLAQQRPQQAAQQAAQQQVTSAVVGGMLPSAQATALPQAPRTTDLMGNQLLELQTDGGFGDLLMEQYRINETDRQFLNTRTGRNRLINAGIDPDTYFGAQ